MWDARSHKTGRKTGKKAEKTAFYVPDSAFWANFRGFGRLSGELLQDKGGDVRSRAPWEALGAPKSASAAGDAALLPFGIISHRDAPAQARLLPFGSRIFRPAPCPVAQGP